MCGSDGDNERGQHPGFGAVKWLGRYLWNMIIALNQLCNTLLGGAPDETISSRVYKAKLRGSFIADKINRVFEWFDPGHGKKVVEWDEGDGLKG